MTGIGASVLLLTVVGRLCVGESACVCMCVVNKIKNEEKIIQRSFTCFVFDSVEQPFVWNEKHIVIDQILQQSMCIVKHTLHALYICSPIIVLYSHRCEENVQHVV